MPTLQALVQAEVERELGREAGEGEGGAEGGDGGGGGDGGAGPSQRGGGGGGGRGGRALLEAEQAAQERWEGHRQETDALGQVGIAGGTAENSGTERHRDRGALLGLGGPVSVGCLPWGCRAVPCGCTPHVQPVQTAVCQAPQQGAGTHHNVHALPPFSGLMQHNLALKADAGEQAKQEAARKAAAARWAGCPSGRGNSVGGGGISAAVRSEGILHRRTPGWWCLKPGSPADTCGLLPWLQQCMRACLFGLQACPTATELATMRQAMQLCAASAWALAQSLVLL